MKSRLFWLLVLAPVVAALSFTTFGEVRAAYFSPSANPELVTLISETVANHESPSGSYINAVTELVCPHVTRALMDQLVATPGALNIRSHRNNWPDGAAVGYYAKPHMSIFQGWRWLFRPGLQIELYDDGTCFAAVRGSGSI